MKTFTKLTMIAATVAAFAGSAALADDRPGMRLEWRWVHGQYMSLYVPDKPMTIAVYADRTGVTDRTTMQGETLKTRYTFGFNAHGERTGFYMFDK